MSPKPTRTPPQPRLRRTKTKAEIRRGKAGRELSAAPAQTVGAEDARNRAEQFRRAAEEAREMRDQHRASDEAIRQAQERVRESAEAARTATEQARFAAEHARGIAMASVVATAENLKVALDQMTLVEELRRTLRDLRDIDKLGRPN
jgi:cell fate (sporulation/competence/biofilm development) regulator YmcA (YheA/YmcA/DUF963 family)